MKQKISIKKSLITIFKYGNITNVK